jgi:type VI secretion system protein ImpL
MFSFFKRRIVLITLGFLLLAVLIIVAGPYFAFAGYEPLASLTARLLLLLFVVAVWCGVQVFRLLRSSQISDKLMAAVTRQDGRGAALDTAPLRESFDQAVAQLKSRKRRGHTLYDLPWYLIIGPPGSGKTTVFEKSGLRFPLERTTGSAPLQGVAGTRNCKWWFTDEAVLLDTAGRYTTQDSDAMADASEWNAFLGLLRKYRPRRPVNGVIFTIGADELVMLGPQARESRVSSARKRLQELNALGVQLPVYVIVTKCDLIPGFKEYFDDLTKEARAQVWGVTFPYEQTADGSAVKGLTTEFDRLIARLNERVFARLEDERDLQRSAWVFGFPQRMATLRESLSEFVTEVFAPNHYQRPLLLRGAYFTSGTQEGSPLDRILSAGLRQMGLHAQAASVPTGPGRAYFIERLLKDVVLAECGLAGMNRRAELQRAVVQLGAYAGMAALGACAMTLLFWSFSSNRRYVDEVAAAVARARQTPVPVEDAPAQEIVGRLDAVRAVVDSATRYERATPWRMRWGLYQGRALGSAARDAYLLELTGSLLPEVAARFEHRLADPRTPPEQLYEYLKAYLMLVEPGRLVPAQVAALADAEWSSAYATEPDIQNAIGKHFRTLVDSRGAIPPTPQNDRLIQAVRASVRNASIEQLVYRRLKLLYSDDPRALDLATAIGTGARDTLSGSPLTKSIPAIYTAPVFRDITASGIGEAAKQFADEQWVWGDAGRPRVSSGTLSRDVIRLYEADYIAAWDEVLSQIDLSPQSGPSGLADVLARASGPNSPLRGLLQVVDTHTYLVQPPDPAAPAGRIDAAKQAAGSALTKLLGQSSSRPAQTEPPGTTIAKHFAKIHELVAGPPGSAPIDSVLATMARLAKELCDPAVVGTCNPQSGSANQALLELKSAAQRLPPSVARIVEQAYRSSTSNLRRGIQTSLDNQYQQEVVSVCHQVVSGNYPFVRGSRNDAPTADVARVFAAQGAFEMFFQSHLKDLVVTGDSPWRWKSDVTGAQVVGSRGMLRQFESARHIRDVLFAANASAPAARFTVTPEDLDAKVLKLTLEIDGQRLEYSHGPRAPKQMSWPGQAGGSASLAFDTGKAARPTREFKGEWALFRLLDTAQIEAESATRYHVAFHVDGYEAEVVLDAASVWNPFDRREFEQFRCDM